MPSPLVNIYKENKIANNHAILSGIPTQSPYSQLYAGNYQYRAQARVMEVLNGYNPFGNGNMPSFTFTIPGGPNMGSTIFFGFGNADVVYNSNSWSSLTGEEKKIAYFWLPNFERFAMLQYDKTYGI